MARAVPEDPFGGLADAPDGLIAVDLDLSDDAEPDADALAAAVGLDAEGRERMAAYRPLWAAFWLAMLLPGNTAWRRNPPGTTEAHARHFMALVDAY